ncbi:cupin domain-containing protein [Rubrimonas cliftonensis]|uniref:(S)-ureidoglycine aminohydrolase cupin domain-containing protein n=1 Tax=Rubrimonas cliftonensis TaxID=89524 RepID=A0A1H4FMM4_9RHOB|nr:cupin domain-containing protein [Rubrimonas cliftonensis]SEA97968.1 hypothetical protein SAMN05444370_12423 [Rubrimonas cliftonensis]
MLAINSRTIPDLAPWGTVADLGAEILDGEATIFGAMAHGAPDAPLSCGWFAVTRSRFRMTYPFNEHAVVVEGSVALTDERTGERRVYGVGDAWFVEKGAIVLWEVACDRFVKNYLAAA